MKASTQISIIKIVVINIVYIGSIDLIISNRLKA